MNIHSNYLRISRKSSVVLFIIASLLALVSSLAAIAPHASAATQSFEPAKKPSYMLIYSDKGKYSKAYIVNASGVSLKCSGKAITAAKGITIGLSKSKQKNGQYLGVKTKCDPGTYRVFYLKKGDKITTNIGATTKYTAVAVTENYCIFTHKTGTTRNEVLQANNRCSGDDDPNEDTVTKYTPVITYTTNPSPVVQGKKYTETVEIKNPSGEAMSPEECAVNYTASVPLAGLDKKNNKGEQAVKYNPKTRTCTHKSLISSSSSKNGASVLANININGNAYMSAATGEARRTVVPNPAAQAKENKKAETAAAKAAADARKKRGNSATKHAKITAAIVTQTKPDAVSFVAEVTGVEDCSRINPSLDAVIHKKGHSTRHVVGGNNPTVAVTQQGDKCVLTSNVSYSSIPRSNVKYKISFKSGTKTIKKTSNTVTLEN